MTSEQVDRMTIGWSREQLARASGVSVASVYLLERMGTAGPEDDARVQNALAKGRSKLVPRRDPFAANDLHLPQNENEKL